MKPVAVSDEPPATTNQSLNFEAVAFFLVRDSQLVAAFGTTAGQNLTAVGSSHTLAEAVFVFRFRFDGWYVLFMIYNP